MDACGDGLINLLRSLVGERSVLAAPADVEPYLSEWRGLYHGRSPCVLRPTDTQQLSAAMKLLSSLGVAIVP
jgi:FAD/FMN-containing dehydrogenase